jgi:hypothetical protein
VATVPEGWWSAFGGMSWVRPYIKFGGHPNKPRANPLGVPVIGEVIDGPDWLAWTPRSKLELMGYRRV